MFTELKKHLAADPFKKCSTALAELQELNRNLKTIADQPDMLKAIVEFFGNVSPWHDRGLKDVLEAFASANYKSRYDAIIGNLLTLSKQFVKAGRDPHGWNRTEKGEVITEDNVYLGNVYGLFTHKVSFWRRQKYQLKDEWRGATWERDLKGMNSYDVVSRQARQFLDSHMSPMRKLLDELEAAVAAHGAA